MTTLTFSPERAVQLGADSIGAPPLANLIDDAARLLKPSTDAFLESVASALASVYRIESDEVEPKTLAFFFADTFLRSIGDEPKVSRISMDSDGEPILEWQSGAARKLTLSFGEDGDISFAGRIAENYFFGNEKYDGTPSETIMSLIKQAGGSP